MKELLDQMSLISIHTTTQVVTVYTSLGMETQLISIHTTTQVVTHHPHEDT